MYLKNTTIVKMLFNSVKMLFAFVKRLFTKAKLFQEAKFFVTFCCLPKVKSTQYKELAPNALWFTK
mgnify:CR=1 FL=1